MKKVLSLFLVVLMLVGMLPMNAINAGAAEVSETLSIFASTGTLASDSLSISWAGENVSFTNWKSESTTAIRTSDSTHFRAYAGSKLEFTSNGGNITKIVVTCTGASYATALVTSAGAEASASDTAVTIVPTASAATYTVEKLTAQVRLSAVAITYSDVDSSECAHTNTEAIEAVAATCTTAGNTAGTKCTDCGITLEGNETIAALGHTETSEVTAATCTADGYTTYTCSVCGNTRKSDWVDATGHSYVDGVCSVCSVAMPTDLDGKYYIAAIRSSGNYIYMTNDLGTASTQRYQIVDSGLTVLPESITDAVDAQVFELIFDASTATYKIKTGDQYLGWTSGNSGTLVDEASAIAATIDSAENGAYNIHYTASDAERYLALNSSSSSNYFAWYKQGQAEDLYLIPVVEPEACAHANTTTTTVDATCTEAGSTTVVCSDCGETVSTEVIEALGHNYVDSICTNCGAEFEGEVDTTEPEATEPEATEPEATEPEATEPEATEPEATEPEATEPAGGYEMATEIIVGDTIIIVSKDAGMELGSFSTTSTIYGVGTAYTDVPAGIMTWTVEAGTVEGSYAFKNADGNYLYWSSGNSLKVSATKDAQASWNVTFDGNDVILVNAGTVDVARHVAWNSGSPRFANYKDSSISGYSTYYTIQFFKYVSGTACEHSWGDWVVTTAPTCTATGIETATCALCGATKTQSVAANGHSFTYTDTAITCANCDYSAAYTLSTIAEAKAYTDTSLVYYVKGIVTYVSGDKIYIEDNTGALLVMFNGEDGAGIALGDEILVWDCLTTYNGLIETTYTTASEYVKVSSGNALPSQTVTIADLLADATNEYLAERVVIENVTIGTINTSGNTALTDADGNTINIYKVSGLSEDINGNDTVTVTAIVSTYNGYQLLINPGTAATDVVEVVAGEEDVVTTVTIAEAKVGTAGEYYQVEGVVTYISGRNVYIQDATGGIVVYLTANAASTKVGDMVKAYGALKVYNGLIELDAVDETNAEFYSILSSDNTVEAQEVTMAGLLADTTNEYLAEKVTLNNVYVSYYSYNSTYKNVNYTLVDGNGNSIVIYRVTVASEEECVAGGSIVNVEAIVSSYNGYQLVTTNDKIVVTGTCAHETTELVNYADATCTEAGYTGDTMCTVCQNYVARGEEIPAHATETHAAVEATCTAVGYTEGVFCTVCQIYISGHEEVAMADHLIIGDIIEPTCTEEGYTRYYCSVCGEEDEVSDYVEALGHSYESVVTAPQIGVQGYTTHTCTACGHSYVDSYTDPLPEEVVLPEGDAALKISGATLTLQADLKVAFAVKPEVLEAYSNVYFKFKFAGKEVIISDSYYNTANGRQMYTLPGVAPRMMNDVIEIEMYGTYEGVEYVYTNTYTVMTYCNSQLGKVTEATKLTTLIVDLMNFGTMQQIYNDYKTDALINASLTEAQKAWGRNVNGDQTFTSVFGLSGENGTAYFRGASLTLSDAVVVNYVVQTDDLIGITLKITVDGEETIIGSEAFVLVEGYTNRYEVKFTGLRARQMRSTITAVVLRDGVETSKTATYSVESYAAGVTSGTNLYNLCQAMMHYGDAAIAYFNS